MAHGMQRNKNDRKKKNRQTSWNRAQDKKAENRKANEAAAARNRELRAAGIPTPHEARVAERRARRDTLRMEGKLPPVGTSREAWEASRPARAKN